MKKETKEVKEKYVQKPLTLEDYRFHHKRKNKLYSWKEVVEEYGLDIDKVSNFFRDVVRAEKFGGMVAVGEKDARGVELYQYDLVKLIDYKDDLVLGPWKYKKTDPIFVIDTAKPMVDGNPIVVLQFYGGKLVYEVKSWHIEKVGTLFEDKEMFENQPKKRKPVPQDRKAKKNAKKSTKKSKKSKK